ncbi:MAG: TAT-variant-translocated molybdopterin oxidoreductase [Chitinophagales bacterium]|nr:TAT-variant-translocated molybdopterin oxidoreductase [Chitinophagales bacterium]MBP8754117.1 TAT-variant-translocated molybdopterin oxidoreductase [Chitinophagales bacterium]MBP9189955.1 TAT-variant-translocated molybdopterin oxidoreductase [Chitinophagales bacterium]MBP9547918.1 TAT-variant-translocated molybdopterin oxidoreductase [Chitinophagales bacterium]
MAEKKYWKGLEELKPTPEFLQNSQQEFGKELETEFFEESNALSGSRRDFLKVMGFSLTAATLAAGCEMPINKVAPYIFKPEDITPGIATWYASTYSDGGDYCSILVKTREGRPIKIEGNKASTITKGGTSARVQASILSLYDTSRIRTPLKRDSAGKFSETTWEELDQAVLNKLSASPDAQVRILTSTVISPSTKKVFDKFTEKYPNTKVYTYDAVSYSGMLTANEQSFGMRAIPNYDFAKAKVILSFDADFLGTWISPVEYTKAYIQNRKVNKDKREMSRHYQVESRMSLTGANADYRIALKPSELHSAIQHVFNAITGGGSVAVGDESKMSHLNQAVEMLKANMGNSLVISGSNDINAQILINGINNALGNYGTVIKLNSANKLRQGSDTDLKNFISDLNASAGSVAMIYNCNPVYDSPLGAQIEEAIGKAEISIGFTGNMDETSHICSHIAPDHHYLESWNDAEPHTGVYSFAQPTIQPLFNTRQMQDSMLKWAGSEMNYHDFMVENWNTTNFVSETNKIRAFNKALQSGLYQSEMPMDAILPVFSGDLAKASAGISKSGADGLEVQLYESIGLGDGRYANNPWLHEMPDPVTKITWDNYLNISPEWAEENDLMHGDIVTLTIGSNSVDLPVSIQPGQAKGSASVAIGFGRTIVGKVGQGVGKAVAIFADASGETVNYNLSGASISKTGQNVVFAQTQTHFNLNDGIAKRKIVKETTLAEYKKNPLAGNTDRAAVLGQLDTFYPDFQAGKNGFNWGMNIDLNTCIGCGACTIACISENNIPVVGKDEVRRAHEMHWIRIDRYYAGENPENPEVVFMPMMCQHCENAPCENVCPVGATNHSSEGFNQMAYNRCIGTRYCANNCPYKVRRFNWYDYTGADTFGEMNDATENVRMDTMDDLTRMVLNPDVTVRSRGVIEKCSFCVQRIQESKLTAKKENRQLRDGDIRTACQNACPADAIVFGNMFDENTEVYKLNTSERAYGVIEENHWLPSVLYMTKVRNKDAEDHVHEERLDIMDLYNYK